MILSTKDRIIDYIRMRKQARAYDLAKSFDVSRVAIHRHLKSLTEKGEIRKLGKPPFVFYVLPEKTTIKASPAVPGEIREI